MYSMARCLTWTLPWACISRLTAADSLPATTCVDGEGAVCDASPLSVEAPSLLQTRRKHDHRERKLTTRTTGSECQNKFAWLHIPKTGTTFANTLYHAANSSLPEDAVLPSAETLDGTQWDLIAEFHKVYPIEDWFDSCFWYRNPEIKDVGTHESILQQDFDEWAGNFVGIFREPKARAKSSFKFFTDRCKKQDEDSSERGESTFQSLCGSAPELGCECNMKAPTYAGRMMGLVTKMLTGQSMDSTPCSFIIGVCPDEHLKPDVDMALERLKGFKFIGLTEEWDLSICLFHTMFGGNCSASEFSNVRETDSVVKEDKTKQEEEMDDAFWEDFVDPYDSVVYGAASRMFWENVVKYNVSLESCASICPIGVM